MLASRLKKGVLALMTVFFLAGGALACERLPTDVAGNDDIPENDRCVIVNGMLFCPD